MLLEYISKSFKESVNQYYRINSRFKKPDNLFVILLNEETFNLEVSMKHIEVFHIPAILYENTEGYIIIDKKNKYRNNYFVYVKHTTESLRFEKNILFHELSHIHTILEAQFLKEENKDTEEGINIGQEFWREFLANYIGNKTYIETLGEPSHIKTPEKFKAFEKEEYQYFLETKDFNELSELISYSVIKNHYTVKELEKLISFCIKNRDQIKLNMSQQSELICILKEL